MESNEMKLQEILKARGITEEQLKEVQEQEIPAAAESFQRIMDIYYLLGELCEADGQLEEASKYFKEIYRADVTYKDIADRVQRIYAAQKEASK